MIVPILAFAVYWSFASAISIIGNTELDANGIYFVSYDGLVNINSFQLSGVLTYGDYQYAGWYTSTRNAVIARRTLPDGGWENVQLSHQLKTNDSHNVIALGLSSEDDVLHVAMDCHSDDMYYTSVSLSDSWEEESFGDIINRLGNLDIGLVVTYPQFVVTPSNRLQFVYRTGVSGNGDTQLAEYSGGSWNNVGSWASSTGSYTSGSGAVSTRRNLYIHGFTYSSDRAHVTGTWREQNGAVSCSSGGLTNHDTVYFYSEDEGRTWKNVGGNIVGASGSNSVNVNTAGIIADSLNADHGLMNQESQTTDSQGLIHIAISYVPGRFTQCVTNYENDRTSYARAFHVFQNRNGSFTKTEIPFAIEAVGRSQIVLDANDNAFVVLPYLRIARATAASRWTDWSIVYDGRDEGLNVFGEIILDRWRWAQEGVLSVMYQENSSRSSSPVRILDFDVSS